MMMKMKALSLAICIVLLATTARSIRQDPPVEDPAPVETGPGSEGANDTFAPGAGTFDNGTAFDFSNNGTDFPELPAPGGEGTEPELPPHDGGVEGGEGSDGTHVPGTFTGDEHTGGDHGEGDDGEGHGEVTGEQVLKVLGFLEKKVHEEMAKGGDDHGDGHHGHGDDEHVPGTFTGDEHTGGDEEHVPGTFTGDEFTGGDEEHVPGTFTGDEQSESTGVETEVPATPALFLKNKLKAQSTLSSHTTTTGKKEDLCKSFRNL